MAISFVNAGTEGSAASGNVTPGEPASTADGDIYVMLWHTSDQGAATVDAAWTEIAQGNGGGTTSRIAAWWWRKSGSMPTALITHSAGQSPIAGIAAYRGCKSSGSPINVTGSISGGTDGSIEHSAVTPTVEGSCLLVCNGSADDNNRTALGGDYGVAFEDSGASTQNCFVTTAGTPDGSVSLFHDLSVPASDTGTITVTQAAADPWASFLVALEPEPPPVPKVLAALGVG